MSDLFKSVAAGAKKKAPAPEPTDKTTDKILQRIVALEELRDYRFTLKRDDDGRLSEIIATVIRPGDSKAD